MVRTYTDRQSARALAPYLMNDSDLDPSELDASAFSEGWLKVLSVLQSGVTKATILQTLTPEQTEQLIAVDPDAPFDAEGEKAHALTANGTPLHSLDENDWDNAQRLVARYGRDMHYCDAIGGWLVWDGRRWAIDIDGQIIRWATRTAQLIFHEAAQLEGDDANRRSRWATRSGNASQLRYMINLAKAVEGITLPSSAFDTDPWLLNVRNGTLDLRTGKLGPFDRADLITKLAPVNYDPAATHPTLVRYLDTATQGDTEFKAYLRRCLGYSLTGMDTEKAFFLMLGPTDSGKTTLVEAMLTMLGDYARKSNVNTFLKTYVRSTHDAGLVALRGVRFTAAVEPDSKASLDESKIKELTGGDAVTTRNPYAKDEITYKPQAKIWMAANTPPKMTDNDDGLWNRVKRLPFERRLLKNEKDPKVKADLCGEACSALLAWCVQGCLAWQNDGLGECSIVEARTSELRADFDPLAEFFYGYCIFERNKETNAQALRKAYEHWAESMGARPLNNREWGNRLKACGCESFRTRRAGQQLTIWQGVGLLDDSFDTMT